jgi:hypothetical protein
MNRGFTLFIAVVITGTLLLIATGIATLAYKQGLISSYGKESQIAFYAADSGIDCALYWDVKNPSGESAFDPAQTSTINCNRDFYNWGTNQWTVGGTSQSEFTMFFLPERYCAVVKVIKGGGATTIESYGFSSCNVVNARRVQRAVRVEY